MEQYRQVWGQRIRTLRKAANMSQRELSVAMNVDQAMVSRWERGLGAPRDENRILLAAILGVTPERLFAYEPDPTNGDEQAVA